ncbi:MAG: protein kinase, partial [Clostridia bacterium]|nr:protein kinase [Clostridia bacterium]
MNKHVFCNGNDISLSDTDYITAGGEGSIYNHNGLIYKIYLKSISQKQEQKLKYLSILKKDNIIAPKGVVYSKNGEPVGYTMNFVDNASSLALLFTRTFKNRNNISIDNCKNIFTNMRDTIKYIHENNILIVDGNELNYMIDNSTFSKAYFLDVDSYQTKDFPATAIMPTIKDYCSSSFSDKTDWYSFAVIMFQLFTGIHPYKGIHPVYNYKTNQSGSKMQIDNISERCIHKISVFNKDVKYPPTTNINDMPDTLKQWFFSIFEKGERTAPPEDISGMIKISPDITINYSNTLKETLYKEYDSDIIKVLFINGQLLVATKERYYLDNIESVKKYKKEAPIVYTVNSSSQILHITMKNNSVVCNDNEFTVPDIKNITIIKNRIFVLSDKLEELSFNKYTNNLYVKTYWQAPVFASKFFVNCIFVDCFGSAMFYIPETKDNNDVLYTTRIKELNGHTIIDAF